MSGPSRDDVLIHILTQTASELAAQDAPLSGVHGGRALLQLGAVLTHREVVTAKVVGIIVDLIEALREDITA